MKISTIFKVREGDKGEAVKPFLDHLEDLRWVIIKIACALGIAMMLAFCFRAQLVHVMQAPLKSIDPRLLQSLVSLGVADSMTISFQLAFYAGIVIAFPFLIYFAGQFVLPALTPPEKKAMLPAVGIGFGLFLSGVVLGYYFVLPATLRFFFRVTVQRFDIANHLPLVRQPRRLPVVLSPEEVTRLLEAARGPKYKAALALAYGAGLRISEIVSLKLSDIDSKRMMIRVEQGKGHKDRYVMLSPHLLELLRTWWLVLRPRGYLFPGQDRISPLTQRQLRRACLEAAAVAGITKRVSPHCLRHYVASRTISGKFGFGPFFGHISRFTGYIVLTASTTPAWGHEPSTVCRRQANSSATIAEGLVASAHRLIARNHCVSSGIPSPQPAHPFALLSPGKTMLGNWRELRAT